MGFVAERKRKKEREGDESELLHCSSLLLRPTLNACETHLEGQEQIITASLVLRIKGYQTRAGRQTDGQTDSH